MSENQKTIPSEGSDYDEALLQWQAPEYPYHEKSRRWFIVAAICVALLVTYGLMTDGWTFSLAIMVFAGTYYVMHREQPPVVNVSIGLLSVKVGTHSFPYTSLKGFWILYSPPHVTRLYLRRFGRVKADILIELAESDPAEVRHVLSKHIKEIKGAQESFSDSLVRFLKL